MRLRAAALRFISVLSQPSSSSSSSSSSVPRVCHSCSHFNSSCSNGTHTSTTPHGLILNNPTRALPSWPALGLHGRRWPSPFFQVEQGRTYATKLKKTKIKPYSSYKSRFKLLANGKYKRWRSGKRHNAHSKTPKRRRQLRRPAFAPPALAKVMKKLHVQ